jgi:hypothetical protein
MGIVAKRVRSRDERVSTWELGRSWCLYRKRFIDILPSVLSGNVQSPAVFYSAALHSQPRQLSTSYLTPFTQIPSFPLFISNAIFHAATTRISSPNSKFPMSSRRSLRSKSPGSRSLRAISRHCMLAKTAYSMPWSLFSFSIRSGTVTLLRR